MVTPADVGGDRIVVFHRLFEEKGGGEAVSYHFYEALTDGVGTNDVVVDREVVEDGDWGAAAADWGTLGFATGTSQANGVADFVLVDRRDVMGCCVMPDIDSDRKMREGDEDGSEEGPHRCRVSSKTSLSERRFAKSRFSSQSLNSTLFWSSLTG